MRDELMRAAPRPRPVVDRRTFISSEGKESFEDFRYVVNTTDAFKDDWDQFSAELNRLLLAEDALGN